MDIWPFQPAGTGYGDVFGCTSTTWRQLGAAGLPEDTAGSMHATEPVSSKRTWKPKLARLTGTWLAAGMGCVDPNRSGKV